VATPDEKSEENKSVRRGSLGSSSWGAMLALVLLAMLIAVGAAYLLVKPYFHQHAP